jgi:hypothetical protein
MTARKPSQGIQEAVRAASEALLASLSNPDEATRQAVSRAAELRVLAQEARASALAGHPVVTADLLRLEDMASSAIAELNINRSSIWLTRYRSASSAARSGLPRLHVPSNVPG